MMKSTIRLDIGLSFLLGRAVSVLTVGETKLIAWSR
jgi:hypothetical protein